MNRGSPPSDYAVLAVVEGQDGAVWDLAGLTLLRSTLISPGLYLAGLRGKDLVKASLAASASISAALLVWYAVAPPKKR